MKPGEGEQVSVESDETLATIVDRILGNSDINNDGFIDFVEFRSTSWHSSSYGVMQLERSDALARFECGAAL
uniref:EF-hand domain-containing protein n=1 Tax=Timema tahoe TaxID=61484 RepID=A0A7R9FLT0_9NEOP|nr:unnamed protein product [Timema tahoe]